MTKAPCPRVIFVRHGQTEWSKSGQHTSVTDLDLTPFGYVQMRSTGKSLIGLAPYQMIKPENLKLILHSPRTRAKNTVKLLLEGLDEETRAKIPLEEENDVREWEYGDYEGLVTAQINELRKKKGISETWDIWADGCEGGEDYLQVTERVDRAIAKIQEIHRQAVKDNVACDIMVVAHGHILRCFAARWVQRPININPQFILDAGGVGVLSYQHHCIEEPAVFLAGAFSVPIEEEGADI